MGNEPTTADMIKSGIPDSKSGIGVGDSGPANGLKHRLWQFFGALFMERKNGTEAVSLHRFLAFLLFFVCLGFWTGERAVPNFMIWTLWGLLGINGANKVVGTFRGKTIPTPPASDVGPP